MSKDGALFSWLFEPEEGKTRVGKWRLEQKHFFNQNAKVISAAFHKPSSLLVVGFSSGTPSLANFCDERSLNASRWSGVFGLYELPDFNNIHTLSISSKKINTVRCGVAHLSSVRLLAILKVCINSTGEWLAFGSAKLGQLLVWEWQSESCAFRRRNRRMT